MQFIQRKYGYYKKGDVSKWVEIAIRNLINDSAQQQQSTKNMQKSQKQIVWVARKWRDACKYILDKTGYEVTEGKRLPAKMLEDAIIFNCGNDDRTVRSWIDKFILHEYIKLTRNPLGYEVVKAVSIPDYNKEELR
jgi:hypothetical protein